MAKERENTGRVRESDSNRGQRRTRLETSPLVDTAATCQWEGHSGCLGAVIVATSTDELR